LEKFMKMQGLSTQAAQRAASENPGSDRGTQANKRRKGHNSTDINMIGAGQQLGKAYIRSRHVPSSKGRTMNNGTKEKARS
jgi:hypothetical protein